MGIIITVILILICIGITNSKKKNSQRFTYPKPPDKEVFSFEHRQMIGIQFELDIYHLLYSNGFHHVFHNVQIPMSYSGTTQIDILLATQVGLFCIECKKWSGTIFGNRYWKRWLKVEGFMPNGYFLDENFLKATELRSPVEQNRFHCEQLTYFLNHAGLSEIIVPTFSIIVFGDSANIDYLLDKEGSGYIVVKSKDLIASIHKLISNKPIIMTEENLNALELFLLSYGRKIYD